MTTETEPMVRVVSAICSACNSEMIGPLNWYSEGFIKAAYPVQMTIAQARKLPSASIRHVTGCGAVVNPLIATEPVR